MKRVSPLAEVETPTKVLPIAPAPWVVRECRETGIVFLENPPGYESLKEDIAWEVTFKRESDARRAAEPLRYSVSQAFKWFRGHVLKRNKVIDLTVDLVLAKPHRPVRFVDLGCGWGQLLGAVIERLPQSSRAGCIPIGVEISTELARLSNEALAPYGGHCVHAPAQEGLAQLEAGSLDIVVMSSFLEHEIRPLELLREAAARLKPGGHVVIKVPNYASWNRKMRGNRWCGFRWPDHVNYFTPETLLAMAKKAGLEMARMNFGDRFPLSDNLYSILVKR